jgi:predicted DNA-binding protein
MTVFTSVTTALFIKKEFLKMAVNNVIKSFSLDMETIEKLDELTKLFNKSGSELIRELINAVWEDQNETKIN